ncbi:protein mono-ADP-ribosyltransferase PARP12 [Cebus imitator]|uniref:Protein mono-ADP-ribosyltransferase PARP12 n=2 Tax=Cebinae TaxID=38070 RepID=A0A2K5RL43_CEBIM|nr:protein mono-ADP-ribosyltransferase PARP12 [Cebus imitator]XP_032131524.1 protein mono-ADP-ribosyltransferase PARP12 [Sapajus apella]
MAQASVVGEVTQVLCAAGGALELPELRRRLRVGLGSDALERLLRECGRFVVAARAGAGGATAVPERVVLAASPLRLCRAHQGSKPGCVGLCAQLHLCKFMVYGACKFLRAGKNCRNSHSLTTDHNLSVLRTHGVDHLSYNELCQLLFQNDPWLLPEICQHYNKGDGPHGSCSFQKQCIKLHICQYFLQGECKFGTSCKRSHNFSNSENLEKLEKLGMSSDLVSRLPSIYRNAHDIKNKSSASSRVPPPQGPQGTSERKDSSGSVSPNTLSQEESDQICLYHIRKSCGFQDKCNRVHFHLPYRWQFLDGGKWKDLDKMELIEEKYCNPRIERILCPESPGAVHIDCLNFNSMTFGATQARRLSTASSVTKPPHFILTTEWIWYWSDEFGSWQEYGRQGTAHPVTSVSSSDVEKAYLAYCAPGSASQAATLQFQAGKHNYELDFKAFIQKNLVYGTTKKVCRRPKYVSPQDVTTMQTCNTKFPGPKNIPDYWDSSALPDPGFQKITLSSSSEEYQKVWNLFNCTLPFYFVQKIERVQNLALWEVYQWQKGQMQKQNGGKAVDERQLFHGTSAMFVDAICQQNFDWRVCGLHGTSYGKGSYFARDAAYSHHYSKSDTQTHTMFLARVLVGEFVRGNASFVRPPNKEGQSNAFYDSCVNSVSDPSIFVIFEKHQVYPEYLIQYTTSSKPSVTPSILMALGSLFSSRQ